MSTPGIKILIVDDHPVLREGLCSIINNEEDMEVCGQASNPTEAIKEIIATSPEIAIVDLGMESGLDGLELIAQITNRFPHLLVLAHSMHDEEIYAERALKAGAMGYVSKTESGPKLLEALRSIHNGDLHLSNNVSSGVMRKYFRGQQTSHSIVDSLTNRELEIFELIGHGYSTREIARRINLKVSTIETHRSNIKDKLMIRTSAELAKQAVHWVIDKKDRHPGM